MDRILKRVTAGPWIVYSPFKFSTVCHIFPDAQLWRVFLKIILTQKNYFGTKVSIHVRYKYQESI